MNTLIEVTPESNIEKGAFLFLSDTDNSIDLFIFKKASIDDLKTAMPLNYSLGSLKDNHNCLLAIFHNGSDYLGSGNLENIPNFIREKNMINLLHHTYDEITNSGFNLTKNKYNNLVNFSRRQLNN